MMTASLISLSSRLLILADTRSSKKLEQNAWIQLDGATYRSRHSIYIVAKLKLPGTVPNQCYLETSSICACPRTEEVKVQPTPHFNLPTSSTHNRSNLKQNSTNLFSITKFTRYCVSPWPSCSRRRLDSLVYVHARGPSSKPNHGAHCVGPRKSRYQWALRHLLLIVASAIGHASISSPARKQLNLHL